MTTKNTKHEAGSVADWYNSFCKKVQSISKEIQDYEDPWDDTCSEHKVSLDRCDCCPGCRRPGVFCECFAYDNDGYYNAHGYPDDY